MCAENENMVEVSGVGDLVLIVGIMNADEYK